MLKYSESLLLTHGGVIADLLELLPAEVTVPVSVPHGEGYQDLVLVLLLSPPLLQSPPPPTAPQPAQTLVLGRKQIIKEDDILYLSRLFTAQGSRFSRN